MVSIRRRRKSNQSKFGAWSEADCALLVFISKKPLILWQRKIKSEDKIRRSNQREER